MNVTLLRLARRSWDGSRIWVVPGAPNAVKTIRPERSLWNAPALSYPVRDHDGSWMVRSLRLDWHWKVAKAEMRKLLAEHCS